VALPWWELEVQAQRRLLRHFATSPLTQAAPPGSPVQWVITGVFSNTHNGIVATRLSADAAAVTIAAVLRRFAERRLPGIWYVSADDTPADLPRRLQHAGCRSERTAVVMGAALGAVAEVAAPPGIAIRELVTAGELSHWRSVAGSVWRHSPVTGDPDGGHAHQHARLYASLPLGPDACWRHWLAYDDARPVGMVSGAFTDTAVLIEHLGVVPGHRGRGIGAALAVTPPRCARALDLAWAVLGPTPHSAPLYRRLGFTLQGCAPDQQFYLP
jgi:GNAT superfamily N-acetyltransferase